MDLAFHWEQEMDRAAGRMLRQRREAILLGLARPANQIRQRCEFSVADPRQASLASFISAANCAKSTLDKGGRSKRRATSSSRTRSCCGSSNPHPWNELYGLGSSLGFRPEWVRTMIGTLRIHA